MLRDLLAVCALIGAIFASVLVANAWGQGVGGGQGPDGQGAPEQQIFATDPFVLEPGLAVVEMTHRGEGSFVVDLLSSIQEPPVTSGPIEFSGDKGGGSSTEVAIALADEEGPVEISKAVKIPAAGEHVFDVKADGSWSVRVEQPGPSDATQSTSFGGDDDTATPLFQLTSGPKRITVNNPSGLGLQVTLLDETGNVVAPVRANAPDQSSQYPDGISSTIDIPESGAYLFNVRADGLWFVEITDGE